MTSWKPKIWIAVLLGIVLNAFTFLYLNRPKLFWLYFIPYCAAGLVDLVFQTPLIFIFSIVCPIHAYFVVKNFEPSSKRGWYSKWWGIPSILAILFTSIFLFRSFLYEPFYFPSSSMEPTIKRGSYILVKKFGFGSYGTFGVSLFNGEVASKGAMQRGKLYVFYFPELTSPFAMRLIGLPGDKVTAKDNYVIVNDVTLKTEFKEGTEEVEVYEQHLGGVTHLIQRMKKFSAPELEEITVPENHYFFMGDNRDNASDSRFRGYVAPDKIVGEVVYIFE